MIWINFQCFSKPCPLALSRDYSEPVTAAEFLGARLVEEGYGLPGISGPTRTPIGERAMTSTERQPDAQKTFTGDETGVSGLSWVANRAKSPD